jgi:hypothetical protein
MPGVEFSRTVSLGHILTIASFILSAVLAYGAIQSDLNEHRWRIQSLERSTTELIATYRQVTESLAKIKEDLAVVRERVERVK